MNKPKVKLEDVVEALDLPGETQAYLNKVTGEVSWFTDEVLSAAQDEDLVIEDYPEWERDSILEAKSLIDSDDFLSLPDKFDFHEYRVMERFCQSMEDEEMRDELLGAIRGSGAFRRFKNHVHRLGIADQWYEFRRHAIEDFAIEWLEANGFEWQEGRHQVTATHWKETPTAGSGRPGAAARRIPVMHRMNRLQLLAAEIFSYSFANYADHFGNPRFDTLMPDTATTLERAVKEQWPIEKLAKKLKVNREEAEDFLKAYHRAVQVVDAENPAEAFRNGVRQSIQFVLEDGLSDDKAVEKLVIQICYRAADLAYLLDLEGTQLSRYSSQLRREQDDDDEESFDEEQQEDDD